MNYIDIINEFTCSDETYNVSKYTQPFDELKQLCAEKSELSGTLYSGKVYRVHQYLEFYLRGENKGKIKIKENQIKETKNNYTHWSKSSKIYNYIVSDRRLKTGVYEPFILIIGNVKDGLNKNKIFELYYENYPSTDTSKKFYKEEEVIAPMNNENIEKVFLVYDRNDKIKWVDVTDLLLKR